MQRIAERIGRMLEKRRLIERDAENLRSAGPLDDLIGSSITYRTGAGGVNEAFLEVRPSNPAAIRLYQVQ